MYDYNYNQGRVLVREIINKYYDEEGRLTNEEIVREYAQPQQYSWVSGGSGGPQTFTKIASRHTQG